MPVKMHLRQCLVPRLPMLDQHRDEMVAMAPETTELAHGLGGTKRGGKQAITMELVQPSTIKAIRFGASRAMLDVAGVDHSNLKAPGRTHRKAWHPVYARRFHHDRGAPTGRQPVGEPIHVTGKGTKFLDRFALTVCRHTDPMLLSSHLEAGGMGMHEGQVLGSGLGLLAFVGHMCLQSGYRWGRAKENRTPSAQGDNGKQRTTRLFHLDRTKA
jgi:hypothetical protein